MVQKKDVISDRHQRLAKYARALSHPVRLYIVELLSNNTCCYSGEIIDDLPIARSTLSQHLNALKEAGLIQGEINPPKIKYCLNEKNWKEAKALFTYFLKLSS